MESMKLEGYVIAELYGPDGELKWRDEGSNLIVDEGINYIWANDMEAATLYIGLKDTGTVAAGDTAGSHAGWAEITAIYTGNRIAFTENASGTDEAISNSGSPASFSITGTDDVYGAFLTDDLVGAGGTLIGAKDFAGAVSVENGDTLNITYTITGSSS